MRAKALATTGLVALALTLSACGSGAGADDDADDMAPAAESTQSEDMATEDMQSDDMQDDDMQSDDMQDDDMQSDDMQSDDMQDDMQDDAAARHGTFAGLNDKAVEGAVTVEDGTVTLSGFSSDEGPDLHLYLAAGTDEAAVDAGTELGEVAFDEASQTFSLDGVDVEGFTDVVVHCDKANAVFGAATLM